MSKDAEDLLTNYLDTTQLRDWPRILCCDSSRSLYCPICCRVLIPKEDWPEPIKDGSLKLPFDVDIILDEKERRTSSTGLHMIAISSLLKQPSRQVLLVDLEKEEMPAYGEEQKGDEGVYVLFPGKDSLPISSVGPIQKLIVLDCKWSSPHKVKMHPNITSLPRVHLVSPPAQSRFWRWHNSGEGMLSTIEAVYFASWQVSEAWELEDRQKLVHLMWLFALQRSLITTRSHVEQRQTPLPFTEAGKDYQREMRMRQKGNPPKTRIVSPDLKEYLAKH